MDTTKEIEEFVDGITKSYGRGEDGITSTAANGNKFVMFTDESLPGLKTKIQKYLEDKIGPVYWRQRPRSSSLDGRGFWSARLTT